MTDNLINFWLNKKAYFRFFSNANPNNEQPKETKGYSLVFEDNFTGETLNQANWFIGQPWGPFHPDSLQQYYGDTNEFVNVKDGHLELYTRYKPKTFYNFKNFSYVTIPYGIGLILSNNSFKYGYFEIEAMLPTGAYLWPAIWLTGNKTWPPEIDIIEAYSDKNSQYSNSIGLKDSKFEVNIHYGFVENNTKSNYGAFSYPIPNNPSKRYVKYGLHWTEKFIKIYYDGYFVFQCTQKNILDYFNNPDNEMKIIINNALRKEAIDLKLETSVFNIKSVKYFSNI